MKRGREPGQVFIGGKPRDNEALNSVSPKKGFTVIDLSTLQELSPLFLGPVTDCDGEEASTLENMWQYRHVYEGLAHWDDDKQSPTETWVNWRNKGYDKVGRDYPSEVLRLKHSYHITKHLADEPRTIWKPRGYWWLNKLLGPIEARRQVYVPHYLELVQDSKTLQELKTRVQDQGENIFLLDYNGPSLLHHPRGLRVTPEMIQAKIEDTDYPFGHGYIVASLLCDIEI